MPDERVKLCECGCGQPAPISKKTRTPKGHRKGEPVRFILGHNSHRPLGERFWEKVDKGEPAECWEWTASRRAFGYGEIGVGGSRSEAAHRVSFRLAGGEIPDGMVVMHTCDNPPCVNPAHLRLGTKADNSADMVAKRRSASGEAHSQAKLTDAQAEEIRRLRSSGVSVAELMERFGVAQNTVWKVVNGIRKKSERP